MNQGWVTHHMLQPIQPKRTEVKKRYLSNSMCNVFIVEYAFSVYLSEGLTTTQHPKEFNNE